MHIGIKDRNYSGAVMKSPTEILATLAALWTRISSAIGRGQAEKAREQQPEIDAMDREIQGMEKESNNGK